MHLVLFLFIFIAKLYFVRVSIFGDLAVSHVLLLETSFIVIIIMFIELLMSKKGRALGYMVLDIGLSILLFSIVTYYNAFGLILDMNALEELESIKENLFSFIDIKSIFLFIDIFFIGLLMIFGKISFSNKKKFSRKIILLIMLFSVTASVWNVLSLKENKEYRESAAQKSGILSYQVASVITDWEFSSEYTPVNPEPYEWLENKTIAHGMGAYMGINVTNSLQAFENSYANGYRVFEVDIATTSDGELVLRHDWEESLYDYFEQEKPDSTPTLDEFLSMKIKTSWEPLSFDGLMELMKEYPDIYIVTDTKEDNKEILEKLASKIENEEPNLSKRIIPQIYNTDEFEVANKYFDEVIYTLYTLYTSGEKLSGQELIDFFKENGIKVVTMPESLVDTIQTYADNDISVYVHTINDEELADKYIAMRAWGVYTDSLPPGKY